MYRKRLADTSGLLACVVTFSNHPSTVIGGNANLKYITTLEDRISLIKALGIDLVIPVEFTKSISELQAYDFVHILSDYLGMKGIVGGPDFALGHNRKGDIQNLRHIGKEIGFWVDCLPPIVTDSRVVKSNEIRGFITNGQVAYAAKHLGRWHELTGLVIEGERRGRTLGFPTANLCVAPSLITPRDGIYATWACVRDKRCLSVTSIGTRPTFGGSNRTIETFIVDFDTDIYDETITIKFVDRIRDEWAFQDADSLVEQMKIDLADAIDCLKSSDKPNTDITMSGGL